MQGKTLHPAENEQRVGHKEAPLVFCDDREFEFFDVFGETFIWM